MFWKKISIALLITAFGDLVFAQEEICPNGYCPAAPAANTNYAKIYQDIWDADQALNGVPGIIPSDPRDEKRGYVVVDEPRGNFIERSNLDKNIITKVVIPDSKRATYELVKKLFDNYTLDQSKPETPQTSEEKAEIANFINAIKDTAPMKVARKFIEAEEGAFLTDAEWYDAIDTLWFDIYDFTNSTPQRSGFEHIFVGEKNKSKLGGYHFWYKYYLDDQALDGYANGQDNIEYLRPRYFDLADEGPINPNAATLRYRYNAYDFENNKSQELYKSTGGFDIGESPEGLIALGMACFYDPRKTKTTVINNVKLEMVLFAAGPDNRSINSFFSKFKGFTVIPVVGEPKPPVAEEPTPPVDGPTTATPEPEPETSLDDVRIIAALVNPDGADANKETVSLINTSNLTINLKGWTIAGNNNNAFELVDAVLDAGEIRTFRLPAKDAQLTNKTAKITLRDASNNIASVVDYDKRDIKSGYTIVF